MNQLPQMSGLLFETVQTKRIFSDSKTFIDSLCKIPPNEISQIYEDTKNSPQFNLKDFVYTYFQPPASSTISPDGLTHTQTLKEYIESLWDILFRKSDIAIPNNTLIPLPNGYIVPGGRFREIYYWDTFFTSLGLIHSGKTENVIDMCDNFVHLINTIGHIPNGNRLYYTTRSQPPFFYQMIQLLSDHDATMIPRYLPSLEKEYIYWMKGSSSLYNEGQHVFHVVKVSSEHVANRYFDTKYSPRPESFHIDTTNSLQLPIDKRPLYYHNIRAAAESGWDFSSRWLKDPQSITTIYTTDIIPIDLNCLLYGMEASLSRWNTIVGNSEKSTLFAQRAELRKQMIQEFMWSETNNFYFDYNFIEKKQTSCWSLASVFPLFVGIATQKQAENVASIIKNIFLKTGGLITTYTNTEEQWDAPNGWPPLQWIAIKGLNKYGYKDLAQEITKRFLHTIEYQYKESGFVFEKYNVENPTKIASGGEYPVQLGFGWTNGVYLDLLKSWQE